MQFQTIIHCRIPRVQCSEHGIKSIDIPWAEPGSRFTALFERLAIDVLLACLNQTKAKELLRLSWDEVHHIQGKAVSRGLSRRGSGDLKYLGVDEKSFLKGHRYATVVSDLVNSRVIDVAQDRKEESSATILEAMPEGQRGEIAAVAVDMWEPYQNALESLLPEADIVHDKFHIAGPIGEAVDAVRKVEHKALLKEGAEDLKGTTYLWLKKPARWSDEERAQFEELKAQGLKVGRAWALKAMFSEVWGYSYEKSARKFFRKWFWWATHAGLKPMAEVAKLLKRHLDNILTYLKHRITNAVAEGLNSKIQQVKSARGFRNFENFSIASAFPAACCVVLH